MLGNSTTSVCPGSFVCWLIRIVGIASFLIPAASSKVPPPRISVEFAKTLMAISRFAWALLRLLALLALCTPTLPSSVLLQNRVEEIVGAFSIQLPASRAEICAVHGGTGSSALFAAQVRWTCSARPSREKRVNKSLILGTMFATRNKCIATSNKCLTSSNKKLLETRSSLGWKPSLWWRSSL